MERTGRRKGVRMQVAMFEANVCIGEMTLFDNSWRTETAVALQNSLTITLHREPLLALTRNIQLFDEFDESHENRMRQDKPLNKFYALELQAIGKLRF